MNWLLLKNSLLVSGGATLLAVCLGFAAAIWIAGLPRAWRTVLVGLAITTLALPPFVVTNCWLLLLGPTGVWRGWLPLNIMSLGGTIWLLALTLWPISLFSVLGSWQRLEPHLLESDMAVRGRHLVGGLLFPLASGALAQAVVLTFVLALNNFAVPAILQVKVYPAEIWIRFSTNLDAGAALYLSWPLVLLPMLMLAWFVRRGVRWPHLQHRVSPGLFRQQLGPFWGATSGAVTLLLVLVSTALPLLQLVGARRTWAELPGALAAGQAAIWGSLSLSVVAPTIVVAAGFFSSLHPRGESVVPGMRRLGLWLRTLLWLPFLVPGVLLGVVLIGLLNRGWFTVFYSSAWIVVLAYVIRYLGPGKEAVAHARRRVDPMLVDVARLEGATPWQKFRYVEWPQVGPQVAAAWYVVFVVCLWDVESMILIVPPGLETLALRVFNLLHYGHNAQVDALCLTLLALALAPLCLWLAGSAVWHLRGVRHLTHGSAALRALMVLMPATLVLAGCSRVADSRLQSRIFDDVRVFGTRGAGVGQINKPRSVAVDLQDNFYVVDMTGRVQKFSSNGVFLLSWQMPQTDLGKPKGMCRDSQGNIVVVEPHYARVNHFSPEGTLVAQWGRHGTNAGMLSVPRAVGMNLRDEVFVAEYQEAERLQKFVWDKEVKATGAAPKWVKSIGRAGSGPGEFNRPEGLCVDPQGRVYVADSCNHRIQVFSSDGQFLRAYGKPGRGLGQLSYPYDICVDASGRQYVCEFGNSRIQVFDANGAPLEIIGGPGGEPGRFSNPWGVALDSVGNLYVADSQNHRVQKLIHSPTDIRSPFVVFPRAAPAGTRDRSPAS